MLQPNKRDSQKEEILNQGPKIDFIWDSKSQAETFS